MRLDDLSINFIQDTLLILRMFAKGKNKILCCNTTCLGASKEKSQALIDNPNIPVFKGLVYKKNCQKVASFGKFRIFLDLASTFVNNLLTNVSQCLGISLLITLEPCNVIASKHRKHSDVWRSKPIN